MLPLPIPSPFECDTRAAKAADPVTLFHFIRLNFEINRFHFSQCHSQVNSDRFLSPTCPSLVIACQSTHNCTFEDSETASHENSSFFWHRQQRKRKCPQIAILLTPSHQVFPQIQLDKSLNKLTKHQRNLSILLWVIM